MHELCQVFAHPSEIIGSTMPGQWNTTRESLIYQHEVVTVFNWSLQSRLFSVWAYLFGHWNMSGSRIDMDLPCRQHLLQTFLRYLQLSKYCLTQFLGILWHKICPHLSYGLVLWEGCARTNLCRAFCL